MNKKSYTEEQAFQIETLWRGGQSQGAIAKRLGLNYNTLGAYLVQVGLKSSQMTNKAAKKVVEKETTMEVVKMKVQNESENAKALQLENEKLKLEIATLQKKIVAFRVEKRLIEDTFNEDLAALQIEKDSLQIENDKLKLKLKGLQVQFEEIQSEIETLLKNKTFVAQITKLWQLCNKLFTSKVAIGLIILSLQFLYFKDMLHIFFWECTKNGTAALVLEVTIPVMLLIAFNKRLKLAHEAKLYPNDINIFDSLQRWKSIFWVVFTVNLVAHFFAIFGSADFSGILGEILGIAADTKRWALYWYRIGYSLLLTSFVGMIDYKLQEVFNED